MKSTRSASSSAVDPSAGVSRSVERAGPASSAEPSSQAARIKRLIAGREYFGIDASVLHAGAERVLERVSSPKPQQRRIDQRSLSEDFGAVGTAGSALLTALLKGGLLQPDGTGTYAPTALFRAYAAAPVVTPLSRERARALIERVGAVALRVNAKWARNAYLIEAVAVTGSYMSRRDPLDDLSLCLIMTRRFERPGVDTDGPIATDPDVRKIGAAMKALSTFVRVRVVMHRESVPRPFAVVFQADEQVIEHPAPSLGKWWERAVASVSGGAKQARRSRSAGRGE